MWVGSLDHVFPRNVDFEKREEQLSNGGSCSGGFNFIRWLTARPEAADLTLSRDSHPRAVSRPVRGIDLIHRAP